MEKSTLFFVAAPMEFVGKECALSCPFFHFERMPFRNNPAANCALFYFIDKRGFLRRTTLEPQTCEIGTSFSRCEKCLQYEYQFTGLNFQPSFKKMYATAECKSLEDVNFYGGHNHAKN